MGEIFEEDSEGLYPFIDAITASEDYDSFLKVMLTEVQRQQQQLPLEEASAPQTSEIEVAVPDGVNPGQVMAVDYLGVRYELIVPEGCGPGMMFRAAISLAA